MVFPEYLILYQYFLYIACVLSVDPSFFRNPKCFHTADLFQREDTIVSASSWLLLGLALLLLLVAKLDTLPLEHALMLACLTEECSNAWEWLGALGWK